MQCQQAASDTATGLCIASKAWGWETMPLWTLLRKAHCSGKQCEPEGIIIDDHLGVQLLPKKSRLMETLKQPGRDEEAFAAAEGA